MAYYTVLDSIQYFKLGVSGNGLCLRVQEEPTPLSQNDAASLYWCPETETVSIWAQLSRFNLKTQIESSL
jgi:hypothetical protein